MISLDFIHRTLANYGKEYGEVVQYCSAAWAYKRKDEAHRMMKENSRNPHANRPALIKTYMDWSTIADVVQQKEKQSQPLSGLPREYYIARTRYYEAVADKNTKLSDECHRKMDELLNGATEEEMAIIENEIHGAWLPS